MEIVKDPRNLLFAALTTGWAGSTVYFYRNLVSMKEEMKKITDALPKHQQLLERHNAGFNEIGALMNGVNAKYEDLLDSFEDMMDSHKTYDLYIQETLKTIVKALAEKEIKVDLLPAPKVDYTVRRKKAVRRRDPSPVRRRREDSPPRRQAVDSRDDRQDRAVDRQDRRVVIDDRVVDRRQDRVVDRQEPSSHLEPPRHRDPSPVRRREPSPAPRRRSPSPRRRHAESDTEDDIKSQLSRYRSDK